MGPLGGALDAIREDVSAAAWSDDGALLAYARHESITVLDLAASASFTTRLMTGVGACTNSENLMRDLAAGASFTVRLCALWCVAQLSPELCRVCQTLMRRGPVVWSTVSQRVCQGGQRRRK